MTANRERTRREGEHEEQAHLRRFFAFVVSSREEKANRGPLPNLRPSWFLRPSPSIRFRGVFALRHLIAFRVLFALRAFALSSECRG